MSDLLKEFEDDMRRQRSDEMWKGFGKYVVWLSIAIVLGTTVGVSWRYWRNAQDERQMSELIKGQDLIEAGEYKRAIAVLDELAKNSSNRIYGLVMLHKAEAQTLVGDKEGAQQTYTVLAAHGNDEPYTVLAGMLGMNEKDTLPEPKKDQPFYYSQMEWRGWQLYQSGKKEEAAAIFSALYDDSSTPPAMRSRMAESLQVIAPQLLLPKTEKTAKADAK